MEGFGLDLRYALVSVESTPCRKPGGANFVEALLGLLRVPGTADLPAPLEAMLKSLKSKGNRQLAEDADAWFRDVYLTTRMPGLEVEDSLTMQDVPEMLETRQESWAAEWLARGIAKGEARGLAKGRKELLLLMVRARFGKKSEQRLASRLEAMESTASLDRVGALLVGCGTFDELLAGL